MLLPCDDRLEEDCLACLSRGFIDHPSVGIAFGSILRIDDQGKEIGTNVIVQHDGALDHREAIRLIAEKFNPLQHPMVRAKIFSETDRFNPSFASFCDAYLWLKLLFRGWGAYVVAKPLTALRCHEDQGQALFRHQTKDNLKKLGDHYGTTLSPDFYKKNHLSLQLFRFVQFFNHNHQSAFGAQSDIENLMIQRLVLTHLSTLYFSLRHGNFSSSRFEAALAIQLVKEYGPIYMLKLYCGTVISAFRRVFAYSSAT